METKIEKLGKLEDQSRWPSIQIIGVLRKEEIINGIIQEHLSELSDMNFQVESVSNAEWK